MSEPSNKTCRSFARRGNPTDVDGALPEGGENGRAKVWKLPVPGAIRQEPQVDSGQVVALAHQVVSGLEGLSELSLR